MEKTKIKLMVNNKNVELEIESNRTLLEILRDDLGLTGTKRGCGKGECGACTVILDGVPVNACLVLAAGINGSEVLTIEGISDKDNLNIIQQKFIEHGAVQCGFCTPGMVMSSYAMLKENHNPSTEDIEENLAGNLCRCTGYGKIVDAVKAAAGEVGTEK